MSSGALPCCLPDLRQVRAPHLHHQDGRHQGMSNGLHMSSAVVSSRGRHALHMPKPRLLGGLVSLLLHPTAAALLCVTGHQDPRRRQDVPSEGPEGQGALHRCATASLGAVGTVHTQSSLTVFAYVGSRARDVLHCPFWSEGRMPRVSSLCWLFLQAP
jgi:hypothetical protein